MKKDSNAGVSCDVFENFKNKNFEEHQGTTVPVHLKKTSPLFV